MMEKERLRVLKERAEKCKDYTYAGYMFRDQLELIEAVERLQEENQKLKDEKCAFVIFDRNKKVVGVISDYDKAMDFIYKNDEKDYFWKGFRLDELLKGGE